MVSSARIVLHFDVHEPIELTDLTLSFGSLAKQYRKFLMDTSKQRNQKINDAEVKLFITKIENNCILAELAGASNILGPLVPLLEYTNLFIDFVKNINASILYFKGLSLKENIDSESIPYSKKDCEDLSRFLSVVSQNKGGKLGLGVAEYKKEDKKSSFLVRFTFSSEDAYDAQKGALMAQRALETRCDADYKNVLMYFHQTNVEEPKSQGRTGDKAYIKAVCNKPLPVFFISELDSDKVKSFRDDSSLNPFKASYRVDVNVETDRNEVPKFYRVIRLYEIIPDDESTEKS